MGGSSSGRATQTGSGTTNSWGTGASSWVPHSSTDPLYSGVLQNLYTLGNTPTQYYPGQTYVSPSELTRASMDTAEAAANQFIGAGQQAQQAAGYQQGVANTAGQNYNFLSNAADVGSNPYVQDMLGVNASNVNQQLQEQWLPSLRTASARAGGLGSSRAQLGESQAVERTANQLANANKDLLLSAYGQGLGAQQSALGQTNALQQAYANPAATQAQGGAYTNQAMGIQAGAGQTAESYQQKALDDAMDRYYYQFEEPWERMGRVANYLPLFADMGTGYHSQTGYQSQNQTSRTRQKSGK